MSPVYIALHLILSLWTFNFNLMNPICLFLSLNAGNFICKRLLSRFTDQQPDDFGFTSALMIIVSMAIAVQYAIPEEHFIENDYAKNCCVKKFKI
ncbi:CLUMA_CG016689, isoform A [Clunio marinus]|uniref:CLUMA_CG016689, isoform A n=1 Tax=Clunio marinus TaxID=568069 RepID=A0A1J1IU00_9DIPT|nr:CLUMA_CG016689, isoform A [Clunio marinus]